MIVLVLFIGIFLHTYLYVDNTEIKYVDEEILKDESEEPTVQEKNFSELGITGLAKLICQKNVDVIVHLYYRLKWGHYESINEINVKTNMLKILNSLGDSCSNGCYCGYVEDRSLADEKSYISGISQKSIIILTKK